jgi:hypothetical protein
MNLSPRAKLALIAGLFALPIAASLTVYRFFPPEPTANYGELILPPQSLVEDALSRPGGTAFRFRELRDRWILVASDSGACDAQCAAKLHLMRQVRVALGRDATRVARVFVADDGLAPGPSVLEPLEDLVVAVTPRGLAIPAGAANDRAHIYLVDPHGNVMMRWPSQPDFRGVLKDLVRLLKASQIG